jgi:hypothetical protein
VTDDLATRRKLHAARMAHASGRRRRVDIGDVVTYDPTSASSQVRGVWQDGAYTRVLVELERGPAWVMSSDCTVTQAGEALDA